MNKVINSIVNRVSCRSYSDKKVSFKKLNDILLAGQSAPSAMNRQIANIVAVRKSSKVEELRKLGIAIEKRDVMYGAKTIVLVHAPREDKFCIQDCTCILENIFVAATALKIDSCWINQFDELLSKDEGKKLRKKLGIPMENMIVGSAILGYRKDNTKIEVKDKSKVNIDIK